MLFVWETLLELREGMMLASSSLLVGCRNIVLVKKIVWKIFMWIFYAFIRSFSYRGKVIIKAIHNIIGFGYSITTIKGEYDRYMGCYNF